MSKAHDLVARDARVTWHPYTQHGSDPAPLPVAAARGAKLILSDGRELIDAISSWWTCLHGHGQPELLEALARQARTLDHVLFAGATHEPAVALAEALLSVVPQGLERVFYSDDGSTAVEVALKIVLQAWSQRGEPLRRTFVVLEGGYHGDTFGAMAVGDPNPFFLSFADLLFAVRRVPAEASAVETALHELGERAAGVLLEPLVQGAGGMRMHGEDFLRRVRAATQAAGVPLIADEVMTGFGRTGALFACGRAGVSPDVMCLAKGLTGGLMPLAATLVSAPLFEAFLHADRSRALFHGHSFTAHPMACAVALASLGLVLEHDVPGKLDALGRSLLGQLEPLASDPRVRNLRQLGGIVAYDLVLPEGTQGGYLSELAPRLRSVATASGVLLRPLGPVVYAMPPACTSPEELRTIAHGMAALVEQL